jgi:hypothetical protein
MKKPGYILYLRIMGIVLIGVALLAFSGTIAPSN